MRTYRGFDTHADATTFKRFLIREGYTGVNSSYNDKSKLWEVHFNCKEIDTQNQS